jgi:hypothetical protein
MKIQILLATLTLFAPYSLCQERSAAGSTYADLLAEVKAGDRGADFKALRLAYADSYGIPHIANQKKAMQTAFNSKNYEDAIKDADDILAVDYVDIDAHYVEAIAQRELQHSDQSEFHRFVYKGLIDSILHSGDGKTPATALQVIDVSEEYAFLRYVKLKPGKQSVSKDDGHQYDIMEVTSLKSDQKGTVYFNIDIDMKREKQTLLAK